MPSSASPGSSSSAPRRGPRELVATGALLGAAGGAGAALFDVASTALWLSSRGDQGRLAVALVALCGSATSLLGALVALAFVRADFSQRWRGGLPTLASAVAPRIALVCAAPLAAVAWLLFTGGRARRVHGVLALRPLAFVALLALTTLALALAARATRAVRARSLRARASFALVALALAGALHALDHRVLPRLYEYLHASLGALCALAVCAAAAALGPRAVRARAGLITLAVAVVALPASLVALDRWDNVRAEVFGVHAPYAHHVLLALDALRPRRTTRSLTHAPGAASPDGSDAAGLPSLDAPHIVIVTVDAMRADRLTARHSPRLWALASRGWNFTRAYAQAPHSSYSIASTMTGEYLHETVPLGQRQPLATLADALGARGYYTAALYTNGIFFTEGERLGAYRERDFGFRRADHVDRRADAQADAAMREIDDVARRGEPPTVLWVHFFDAHEPYGGTGATPEARYDDAIHRVDSAADRVIAYAHARLARPVVVALAADHGEEFGEHGGVYHGSSLYEEQVRVPLALIVPGATAARIDAPVELVDLAPTLLALASAPRPGSMRGRDLRALAVAPGGLVDRARWPAFSAVNTRTMVVRWPDKLIADLRYDVTELYDLSRDPAERTNLAGSDPARAGALRDQLATWIDALGASAAGRAALARGRMGERRAVPDLVALALDARERVAVRAEAIDVLAAFDDPALVAPLASLLDARALEPGDRAACALGTVAHDPRALARLRDAVRRDEPDARARAALALARYHDASALDALRDLVVSPDEPTRLAAVDALGLLGTRDALDPLLASLEDDHLRYRVVLALGRIADPSTFARLAQLAQHDRADDVRANAVAALAVAGDRDAVALLTRLAADAPSLPYTASSLGRLGAIGREIPGWDARAPGRADGLQACAATGEPGLVWRYLDARACTAATGEARVTVALPASPRAWTFIARVRNAQPVRVTADGRDVATLDAGDAALHESRTTFAPTPRATTLTLRLHSSAAFELGHLAFVPSPR